MNISKEVEEVKKKGERKNFLLDRTTEEAMVY